MIGLIVIHVTIRFVALSLTAAPERVSSGTACVPYVDRQYAKFRKNFWKRKMSDWKLEEQ
jgi:hypothetical protein